MSKKDLEYYLNLKYPFIVRPLTEEEGGGYAVEFPDLPFCIGTGNTIEEAIEDAQKAKNAWLEVSYEDGDEIPEPGSSKKAVKIPGDLYRAMENRAKREGKTVDEYVEEILKKVV